MTKVAIYARYSSDNQRDASIEDQLRICREHAAKVGWSIFDTYTDHGLSGASMMRPGIQAMMQDAMAGRFDHILAESLDRLSRDQEDVAGIFKRLSFAGVKIVTLSEGEISHLHIGLKGTMNALYLKDLADKTGAACVGASRPENLGAETRTVMTWSSSSTRMAKRSEASAESTKSKRRSCSVSSPSMQLALRHARSPSN
jgi:DNA invertase Pin-like site-specific DNA recombinase